MSNIAAMASGVYKTDILLLCNIRTVIMRADEEIDSFKTFEKIQPLAFV